MFLDELGPDRRASIGYQKGSCMGNAGGILAEKRRVRFSRAVLRYHTSLRSALNTRMVDLRTALGRIRCSARLRGTIAACLRKVNEIDVFTGGKYDFVLSNKEHGENVRG